MENIKTRFEYQESSMRLLKRLDSNTTRFDKSLTFEVNKEKKAYDLGQMDLMNLTRRPSAINTERNEKKDSFDFEKSIEMQKEESTNFAFNTSPNETPKSLVTKKWTPNKQSNSFI